MPATLPVNAAETRKKWRRAGLSGCLRSGAGMAHLKCMFDRVL